MTTCQKRGHQKIISSSLDEQQHVSCLTLLKIWQYYLENSARYLNSCEALFEVTVSAHYKHKYIRRKLVLYFVQYLPISSLIIKISKPSWCHFLSFSTLFSEKLRKKIFGPFENFCHIPSLWCIRGVQAVQLIRFQSECLFE